MARIRQLDSTVINQIAAGEVIERPASVVKELLENAVDAGSTRIDIDVTQGGADLIRVVDDGGGICADDLPLAFASHATSKLSAAADLFKVGTLGFRGEALASIGSIAQVTLQSRPPDQSSGAEITCHGGQLSPVRPWNGTPGTRVEVRHLFYNVPVRRKFLRGQATEMSHLSEVFVRLALSHLRLHLTLRHNGKPVYEVPGSAGLLDRIGLFFGREVREQLYPVEAEHGPLTVGGYVADPACERGGPGTQYFFVNGRWVRDRLLTQALQEAYRGLLMTGRHAVAFLYLDVPPEDVDVNVHPAKTEVRFRDPDGLQQLLVKAVRDRLQAENLTARLRGPTPTEPPRTAPPPEPTLQFESPLPSRPAAPPAVAVRGADRQTAPPREPRPATPAPVVQAAPAPTPEVPRREGQSSAVVRALQLHDTYLAVEVPEGLLLIDQHALHERILYEQLRQRLQAGPLDRQRLLLPEPVDLPAHHAALLLEQREALAELALDVEPFGGGTVALHSYPTLLGKKPPRAILRAVVDYLVTREKMPGREQLLNDLLSLMACHSAIRAGDRLAPEEISALVAQRDLADNSHHCPHGRPTSLLFTHHDLERQFRRV